MKISRTFKRARFLLSFPYQKKLVLSKSGVIRLLIFNMELVCSIQNYEWGKNGSESLVARFAKANMNINIVEDKPYAEFWMGIHENGPSILKESGVPLAHHIALNPSELGNTIVETFDQQLPFLLKILSVNKALSIQVHPSKSEAEYLHKEIPNIYKDSNHKPEIAIAVTEFKALCSFRPILEIKFFLRNIPEFEYMIGKEKIENFLESSRYNDEKLHMKNCFHSLMLCNDKTVSSAAGTLLARLQMLRVDKQAEFHYDLVKKLNAEYPGDIGIFCIYWLNFISLKPGEALYLSSNEPHAYLSGDCIECMANSDNVIRAGLTPKLKDVPTLCKMLSFNNYSPSDIIFKPKNESEFSLLFSPPVKDFAVAQITIPEREKHTLPRRQSASLFFVLEGIGVTRQGKKLKPGMVFYLPVGEEFSLMVEERVTIYQAFCNV